MKSNADTGGADRSRRWGLVIAFAAVPIATLVTRYAVNFAPDPRYWFTLAAFAVNLIVCATALAMITGGRRPRTEFGLPAAVSLVVVLWFLIRILKYSHILNCGSPWCRSCN